MEAIGFDAVVLEDLATSELRAARATLTLRATGGKGGGSVGRRYELNVVNDGQMAMNALNKRSININKC